MKTVAAAKLAGMCLVPCLVGNILPPVWPKVQHKIEQAIKPPAPPLPQKPLKAVYHNWHPHRSIQPTNCEYRIYGITPLPGGSGSTVSTPEPGTLALLAGGLMIGTAVEFMRRRKKRRE